MVGRNANSTYGNPPDPITWGNTEYNIYSIYCNYSTLPEITNVSATPSTVGFGFEVNISADVCDTGSIDTVSVNITYPDNNSWNYTMYNSENNTYEFVVDDTILAGQYNYTIWAVDDLGDINSSTGHSFNVSGQATISVCTVKDEYGNNTIINLTDPPPESPEIGYELLDDGKVLCIWNKYDSYYFNTSSGIQITNHYDEYWSHNVLMLGYYNNDQWNLIYRTDELSGFNKNIDSDNETYVNITLWKDLAYQGYNFRLAIRYYLGVDDNELTVIPYIKNIGDEDIPYNLGFAWEINDIQIDMTTSGDYIEINGTSYFLNESLDETYKNMTIPSFYIKEASLNYLVKVKSRDDEYNAPVTLAIKIGTLDVGQEKYTSLFWHDASEAVFYFNNFNTGEAWATYPGYMVDGSTSYYASTTTDGDIELCDGNNCSGGDMGTISKVELRANTYYTGDYRDLFLRPVFNGTTDGINYPITPGVGSPGWSYWYDITNDPLIATASWNWTNVKNLDCDVEVGLGMMSFTMYCSKVEMRVTYTPYYPPEISDPYPSDGSDGVSISPMLNITVSDPDGESMDITWLSNSSDSWVAFGWNNSVGNSTYHQTMSNASINGQWWYWKVNVSDGTNYTVSDVYRFYTGYQSKIVNTGSTDIQGYLLIQVQYYNSSNNTWIMADDTVNESFPRTIEAGGVLALDSLFNGKVNTSNLSSFGNGTYRIYAVFRDHDYNVLVCDDESELIATYEFKITFN
jgi:hypothetical protein